MRGKGMKRELEIDGKPRSLGKIIESMGKFRKKPVVIKARRIYKPFRVQTKEGIMSGKAGDWLIIGIEGEAYPCDHRIFEKTYEEVKK